ncbi:hypothetical protein LWE69_21565 [Paenibacillus sp. UKAQ_18]|nr:hypothetical protein [Paenibacillus sp. UKAQ_18]
MMKQEYIEKILPTKLKRFGITWLSAILLLSAGGPAGLSSGKASAEPASFAGKEVQPSPVTVGASVYADVYFPKSFASMMYRGQHTVLHMKDKK